MLYEYRFMYTISANIHLPIFGVRIERGEVQRFSESFDALGHYRYSMHILYGYGVELSLVDR